MLRIYRSLWHSWVSC